MVRPNQEAAHSRADIPCFARWVARARAALYSYGTSFHAAPVVVARNGHKCYTRLAAKYVPNTGPAPQGRYHHAEFMLLLCKPHDGHSVMLYTE